MLPSRNKLQHAPAGETGHPGLRAFRAALTAACWVLAWTIMAAAPAARAQADYAREKRWADEIVPSVVVGDPVWLQLASGRKFLALWAPVPKAAGGLVIVHGLGLHPDWGLIGALRSRLADEGYATLSVQMPVLAADAKADRYPALFPEAAERLAAAMAFLRGKGLGKVAIVSHSLGARMANHFLAQAGGPKVDAWVAIGLSGELANPAALDMPILDLHGERDQPAVLKAAPARATVLRKIRGSAQVRAPGADHFFAGAEAELVRHVRLFLDRALR